MRTALKEDDLKTLMSTFSKAKYELIYIDNEF